MMKQSRRSLLTSLLVVKIMKLILRFSFTVMMVFLLSLPQYSVASKNLQQTPKKKTESLFIKESLDKINIAQRQRRSGPRGGMSGQSGRMSGPRGGMSGQRGRMSGPRGGMSGQRGMQGRSGQQMGQEGEALTNDSAEGTSEIESDQSMGQTQRRRGRRMRNRMRNRMQQRGMQGRGGQQMGQEGGRRSQPQGDQ